MNRAGVVSALVGASILSLGGASVKAAVVTAWTFDSSAVGTNTSPTPEVGSGTASTLNMATYSNAVGAPGTDISDILANDAASSTGTVGNSWRIRGSNNGWSTAAPSGATSTGTSSNLAQGAEFDTSTVGYTGIKFTFDWENTKQAIDDMEVQYNLNTAVSAGWTDLVQISNLTQTFQNGNVADLSNVLGAANDPFLGIRLLSTTDPNVGDALYGQYRSGSAGTTPYNNSSGNWRFDNVTFSGTAVTAVPEPVTVTMMAVAGMGLVLRRRRH